MKNKKIITFTLFIAIICLIGISYVSAADDNLTSSNNDIATSNNVDIINSNNNDEGTFSELNTLIKRSGKEIILDKNYTYDSAKDSIYVSGINLNQNNLVIDGNGYTINGNNHARPFMVNANNILIKNIKFINGFGSNGGALYFVSGSNNTFINSTFIHNTADSEAGALYFYGNCSYNNIINSTFIDNVANAYYGGAIAFGSNSTYNTIQNTSFLYNGAPYAGAILYEYYSSNNIINDSIFINNQAGTGGAIHYMAGVNHTIINSIFINNFIESGYAEVNSDYNWWGNTNENYTSKPNSDTKNWLFLNVKHNATNVSKGDLIKIDLILNQIIDERGNIETYDGLRDLTLNINATKGTIKNKATLKNGKASLNYLAKESGEVSIIGSYYNKLFEIKFDVREEGDDSFSALQKLINKNDEITLNKNYHYTPELDAPYMNGIKVNRSNIIINGNGFKIDGKNMSRIFNINSSNITIKNIILENGNYNSTIYFNNSDNNTIENAIIKNNIAMNGAAIHYELSSNNKIINSTFEDNTANSGAAISSTLSANNSIINSTFRFNKAANAGAVYYDSCKNNTILNSEFISNSINDNLGGNGGAIYFINSSENKILNSKFINNSASNYDDGESFGGAVMFRYGSDRNLIDNSIFINNRAYNTDDTGEALGGAIGYSSSYYNNISNTVFINNSANGGGAITLYYASNNVFDNLTIVNNKAKTKDITEVSKGGAIQLEFSSNTDIRNSLILNNEADIGSGIYLNMLCTGNTLVNSIIINNTVQYNMYSMLTANYNWWGNTKENYNQKPETNFELENWLFLNASANTTTLSRGESALIKFDLDSLYHDDGSITENTRYNIPNVNLTFESKNGKIDVNALELINGKGEILYTAETGGNGSLIATYNNINTEVQFTIIKNNLSDKISLEDDKIISGDNLIINLPDDATGNITATIGNMTFEAAIENGKAIIPIPDKLFTKNYTLQIQNSGDDNYNPANVTFNITIIGKDVNIFAPEIVKYYNGNEKFNITIMDSNGNPIPDLNAYITFNNNTYIRKTNSLGMISINANINCGEYNVSVLTITNEGRFNESSKITIKSTIDSDDINMTYLDGSQFKSTFLDINGNPLKNTEIKFQIGNTTYNEKTNENGEAYLKISNDVGNYKITSINTNTTQQQICTININKSNSEIRISVEVLNKGNVIINAITSPYATENITWNINNKTYTTKINETLTLNNLNNGVYTIKADYSGDKNYFPSTNSSEFTISREDKTIINAMNMVKYWGGSDRLNAILTTENGEIISNKKITFFINGNDYNRTTNVNGSASIAINLPSGNYEIKIVFAGDKDHSNATKFVNVTILPTIIANDLTKVYRNDSQFYVTSYDKTGIPLADSTITFNINGVFYNRTTNEKGVAKLNINLAQGEYIITSTNTETGENIANKIIVIAKIIENKDLTKYYRNATQYTVKVIGDNGKAVGAGETVTFNINGVFYTRTTNESGIAKLNLNLQPGDYIITAEYKDCRVSNNIKILPVLSAEDITMKYRDGTQFSAKLVDGQGNPYAGQNIKFNINGVLYDRSTDVNGQAKLNINLMSGQYIITSSYNGMNIANKITIS